MRKQKNPKIRTPTGTLKLFGTGTDGGVCACDTGAALTAGGLI
jgi:hypothetical protein